MTGLLRRRIRRFPSEETGATAVEYSLIAAAIFLGIAPLVLEIDTKMDAMYQKILDYFSAVGVG